MRVLVTIVLFSLIATAAIADDPSVKQGAEEVGRAVKDDAVDVYDKTKDATLHGVGTAVDKTGEGLDKAGRKIEDAGEKVKDKAE